MVRIPLILQFWDCIHPVENTIMLFAAINQSSNGIMEMMRSLADQELILNQEMMLKVILNLQDVT